MDALLGLVAVEEGQERFAGAGVDVGTMATTKPDPFLPFAGYARHEAAAYVKVLGGNEAKRLQLPPTDQ